MATHASRSDEEILEEAVALSATEREAFLARACNGDAAQRGRVAALLAGYDRAGDFLQAPILSAPGELAEKAGDVVDRYTLVQRLGEGGWGVVWLAQQEQPLRRQVAFKVIKLGMDTSAVVRRFEAERQALALMDHPHIARVFDAGVTRNGRPYFVMELVRGVPITKYCDQRQLTTRARLELFIAVCAAVQHAHQKGIVHRDLKPSNILVAEEAGAAVPKVIDFGIAKAIEGRLGHQTMTGHELFIGTPVYMSPEQADLSSPDIDTRSDIYSLGVLLFELLSGRPPFDSKEFMSGGVDRIRQRIREAEPATPSVRLRSASPEEQATLARLRGSVPSQLSIQLRGDLDWIVMRCLEKDRARRYDTVSALAADLRRHLQYEPVMARPPGRIYVFGKWIRRHRTTAAILFVVALAGIVSTWQAVRATRAEHAQSLLRRQESELRQRAETQEFIARRRAYAADMNLIQLALANENLGLAKRLLERYVPAKSEFDFRGWEWRYLWKLCQSEASATIAEEPYPVPSLSVSPDGAWLAVGQDDGGVLSLRNLHSTEEIRTKLGVGAVRAAFSPVESLVAIAYSTDRDDPSPHRLRLWDLQSRQTVAEWSVPGPAGPIFFSPDGKTLVTAGGGRTCPIDVWSVADGRHLGGLASAGGATLAMSPDFRFVARELLRDGRASVQMIELSSGRELWTHDISEENVSAVAFSPNGRMIATAAGNSEPVIRLWDAQSGSPLGVLNGHHTYVSALCFYDDGKALASASKDQTVRLWDVAALQLTRTFRGHELEVHSLALLPGETSLVSGAKDGAVLRWDMAAPVSSSYVRLNEPVMAWRFTPDSRALITVDNAGMLARRGGRDFSEVQPLLDLAPLPRNPQRLLVARNAPWVVIASETGEVRIYDWEQRKLSHMLRTEARAATPVAVLAHGERLLLAYPGQPPARNELHEWDTTSGTETRSWHPAQSAALQFTVSPNGALCAVREGDGSVSVIDLESGTERPLKFNASQGNSAGLSPDGWLLAMSSGAGWVKVWDVRADLSVADLSGFILGVHSAVFSPDGRRMITGSGGDEAIRIWDVGSFDSLLTLGVQGSRLSSTAMSPDGNLIGSRTNFGRLHIWRAPPWSEIDASR